MAKAKAENHGDDPVTYAMIHRFVLAIEARAIDLYYTDADTFDLIELVCTQAINDLYHVKPKLRHSHKVDAVCDDKRYEPCDDVCVPKGCCNIGGGDKDRRKDDRDDTK